MLESQRFETQVPEIRKPTIRVAAVLLLLATLCGLAADARAEDLNIGLVLVQEANHYRRDDLDAEVINAATEAFLRSRRFTVVERHALDTVFQEKGLKGFIGDPDGADMGETLGLDWIGLLSYSVDQVRNDRGEIEQSYRLAVRMLEVSSARVLHTIDSVRESSGIAKNLRASGEEMFNEEMAEQDMEAWSFGDTVDAAGDRLLENLRETFPPYGYVIQRIDDHKVVVDLGTEEGLRKGDKLEVFVYGDPILHPVTGREIPGREITRAVLKVLTPQAGLSTCKVKKSEGEFYVGARVRFKSQDGLFGRMMDKLPFGG
jgi:hypothetical protein